MAPVLIYTLLPAGAIVAALSAMLGFLGTIQAIKSMRKDYFCLTPYLALISGAADTLFSNRQLDFVLADLTQEYSRSPVSQWIIRVCSVLILALSAARVSRFYSEYRHAKGLIPALTVGYLGFWLGSVGVAALFSAHPYFSHEFLYTALIGSAALLQNEEGARNFLLQTRNALLLFVLCSLIFIPLRPTLVLELAYSQGFIPGMPRLAGLASHAVILGYLAQVGLFLVLAFPLSNRRLHRLAIAMTIVALVMAQSKTAWTTTLICLGVYLVVNCKDELRRHMMDPQRPQLLVALISAFLAVVLALGLALLFGEWERVERFLTSSEGAQLTSLTGRDRIWAAALNEWQAHPLFGYGLRLFDVAHRLSVGITAATHSHNQFIDMLARCGLAGFFGLLFYVFVLIRQSIARASAYKGLPLMLLLAMLIRTGSEIPMSLYSYGPDFLVQLALLSSLIASLSKATQEPSAIHELSPGNARPC